MDDLNTLLSQVSALGLRGRTLGIFLTTAIGQADSLEKAAVVYGNASDAGPWISRLVAAAGAAYDALMADINFPSYVAPPPHSGAGNTRDAWFAAKNLVHQAYLDAATVMQAAGTDAAKMAVILRQLNASVPEADAALQASGGSVARAQTLLATNHAAGVAPGDSVTASGELQIANPATGQVQTVDPAAQQTTGFSDLGVSLPTTGIKGIPLWALGLGLFVLLWR